MKIPTDKEVTAFLNAVKEADEAQFGDSNDSEIEILRDCVDLALGMLDLERLEVEEPEPEYTPEEAERMARLLAGG